MGGLEFNGKDNLRITVEGYYKKYKTILSLRNQISLTNLGGGFGLVETMKLDSKVFGETSVLKFSSKEL